MYLDCLDTQDAGRAGIPRMIKILYEDNHLLAIDKPAGLLSQGDATGDASAVDLARDDLRVRYQKPGNVFVGLLHRLDRPVSGVLMLAKTSKAASRLSRQFHGREVEKTYLAIVEGIVQEDEGRWMDRLVKDNEHNTSRVVDERETGRECGVDFQVLGRERRTTLVQLLPITGRGHQLRVQLSSRGLPIVGDRRYGSSSTLKACDGGHRIALHASRLTFNHPTREERMTVESPLPADWPGRGRPN